MRADKKNILILIIACAIFVNAGYAEPNQPKSYVLATGSKTGVYYLLGLGIEAAVEALYGDEIDIKVVDSNGSMDNLERLEKGTADLAFAQSNISDWFVRGEKIRALPPKRRISAVASLYTELIHITARAGLDINRINGLKGRNVRTGSDPNARFTTATDILKAAGFRFSDVNEKKLNFEASRDALQDGSIDAAFITAGAPTPFIQKLFQNGKITFVRVSPEVAGKLCEVCPYFVYAPIPAKTYGDEQTQEIDTVGVRALLVTHEDVPRGHVHKIATAIFTNTKRIRELHERGANIRLSSAKAGVTKALAFHEGAQAYLDGIYHYTFLDRCKRAVPEIVFGVVLIALFLTCYTLVSRSVSKGLIFKLSLVFLGFYTLGAIAMLCLEGPENTHFRNLPNSFWSLAVYLGSGFEDRPPITTPGKITSIIILLVVGVGFSGAVTGNFASLFIKEKKKMSRHIEDHIVICNWNERGPKIVEQLHHKEAAPHTHIVIIADRKISKEELTKRYPGTYDNVDFIEGDPESPGVLKSCKVHSALSVIILTGERRDGEAPRDPDDRSISIALAIRKEKKDELSADSKGGHPRDRSVTTRPTSRQRTRRKQAKDESDRSTEQKPHVVAEIVDHRRIENLKEAGVHETVCATELGLGVLAQSALHHNLSNVYDKLLQYSPHTNEIYVIEAQEDKIPGKCEGKTFEEAAELINKNRDPKNPVILLGLYRKGQIILNPRKKGHKEDDASFDRVEQNDGLVVMAFSPPKLSYLAEGRT
jgi:hypothetical protein